LDLLDLLDLNLLYLDRLGLQVLLDLVELQVHQEILDHLA
jgi:hypothetical protein